jgi:hypothetical protein
MLNRSRCRDDVTSQRSKPAPGGKSLRYEKKRPFSYLGKSGRKGVATDTC